MRKINIAARFNLLYLSKIHAFNYKNKELPSNMSISEEVSNKNSDSEKKNSNEQKCNEPQTVKFQGKNIEIEKLKRKVSNKPRILGTILINISIILVIIIILLLLF